MTEAQHLESFSKVRDLMYTYPRDLLPKHRYLLEEDFARLGEGSSLAREYWVGSMEAALAAATHGTNCTAHASGLARLQNAQRKPRSKARTSRINNITPPVPTTRYSLPRPKVQQQICFRTSLTGTESARKTQITFPRSLGFLRS